ncbi:response regulator [Shewanella maritima]|uniref:Response regulator n=1 Tax=Shewanella maritima TaxID=2520507 RepID=A0A411PCY0_9GAMM|nr:HD domain-containing phosphohydrolase [Shewanella maritima]QBF81406.1 response regulator [Shewanella maritima]
MTCDVTVPTKHTILVVDDQPENIDILRNILKHQYKVIAATDGQAALKLARRAKPDLILLDIMMPGIDGYCVCKRLKEHEQTAEIPVIFVTALGEERDESRGLEVGAVDYLVKPISANIALKRIKAHLALHYQQQLLELEVDKRTSELAHTQLEVVKRLGRAAEYKDNETGMHVQRMSRYSHALALKAGFSQKQAQLILTAAPMHDVGKIGIPDHILLKPGKLTPEEWKIMQAHVDIGLDILSGACSELLALAAVIVATHHEKWDGTGYPKQLKGEQIPLVGRIVAIADVFDALTADRPYKKAWATEDAIAFINEQSGKHFDPHIVRLFNESIEDILQIKEQFKDEPDIVIATDG